MNNLSVSEVKFFSESKGVDTYGFHIERPEKDALISGDQFVLAGWIVGRTSRAVKVNVLLSEKVIAVALVNIDRPDIARAIPVAEEARSSGFRIDIPIVTLQDASEINVIARLADGTQVVLASICFEKQEETRSAVEEIRQDVYNISDQYGKLDKLHTQRGLDHESKDVSSISDQEGGYTRFVKRLKAKFNK